MKKYNKLVYVLLIIIIAVLAILLYQNVSKGNENDKKSKGYSEVKFLESKLESLMNQMNNIETRNYNVSVSQISNQSEQQNQNSTNSQSSSNNQSSSSEGSGSSQSGQSESGSEEGGSQTSEESSSKSGGQTSGESEGQSEQNNQKFNLESSGVLSKPEEVNWSQVKSEIEVLYASIPTITLDLYQLDVNQEDILAFNKEFDQLTVVAKDEKKEESLQHLATLYEYIPKFMEKTTDDEVDKTVIQSKLYLFKAYSKLDSKNWEEISNDVKQMTDIYSRLMTNTNIDSNKQYGISKCYIMINELQNAVNVKDDIVFLIKYENIIEEINLL